MDELTQLWIAIIQYGHQLGVKSIAKALSEDEAMAYYAICRFIRIKMAVDAYVLEQHLEERKNERSSETERGGT